MVHIQSTYKINSVDEKCFMDKGFRKTEYGLVCNFPVYKYKNKSLIFTELLCDMEENILYIRAYDHNGNIVNYNKEEYGRSDVTTYINREIWKRLNMLINGGIIC